MDGHKIKAFVITLILFFISMGIEMLFAFIPLQTLSSIIASTIQSFVQSFNCIVVTVIYFSARCQVEQFDLELLAQSVESITPSGGQTL